METEKQKMIAGKMYNAMDPELRADIKRARDKITSFNQSAHSDEDTRKMLLQDLLGTTSGNCYIEPPLRVDYGYNIHVGKNFYANFNCVFLDCAPIRIGDDTMFGPNVQVYTATHPVDAVERCSGIEYAKEITIGNMCWIGGGAILCPGVKIGDRCVVAAGAVVTKDVPSDVVVGGNPAKIIKHLKAPTENEPKR
ncbi:hypothetical protein K450DRAFT_241814 [Umbelopsis ramanniana AG]|uniref:Maltose/galactoside acetyltransferase domain-containing protein n=1 Tax=Umbelopsis ramanniana AG TaxID=1314678 RepID=A0AAD5EAY7_UMBRA|nr:uncharacterized protein K450DRAFT_241814 [Umbelopsis ramanniana AG]KAI8579611.1 hypothetical protein K450DRAFT_241814 [Umbelopsis ramanniana AG]